MCDQQRLRPACAYAQSGQSICYLLEYSIPVKLLTEQNLEFLSLIGGFTGSHESTLVKMPHSWKSHVGAHVAPFIDIPMVYFIYHAKDKAHIHAGTISKLLYGLASVWVMVHFLKCLVYLLEHMHKPHNKVFFSKSNVLIAYKYELQQYCRTKCNCCR